MTEIGTERLEPTAQVTERVSDEGPRERRPKARRPAMPAKSEPEPADQAETTPHQVDSLA
jgi:hypothetical protein